MTTIDHDHGVLSVCEADELPSLMGSIGITDHTPEDCTLSGVLHSAIGDPVLVDGPAVWIFRSGEVWGYRISAGERRRLLNLVERERSGDLDDELSYLGEVTLEPWKGGLK